MSKKIERHSAVIEMDLPEIYAFIAKHNPSAAERVLIAIEETFQKISTQPECGVPFRTRKSNLRATRMLPVSGFQNYLVFYRVTHETDPNSLRRAWREAFTALV